MKIAKRTYRYRQWRKFVKSDDYALYEAYSYKLQSEPVLEQYSGLMSDLLKKISDELSQEIKDTMYGFDMPKSGKPVTFMVRPADHFMVR